MDLSVFTVKRFKIRTFTPLSVVNWIIYLKYKGSGWISLLGDNKWSYGTLNEKMIWESI